jgi:ferric-dicitrate binding protein FerR (iron transport regulator)
MNRKKRCYASYLHWETVNAKKHATSMHFNGDEFLILLLRQLENCTNWDEDRYIDHILRKYEVARQLKQDVRETYPKEAEKHPYFVTGIRPLVVVKGLEAVPETLAPMPVRSPRKRMYRNIAAAALIAVAITLSLFLVPSIKSDKLAVRDSKGVTLQLAKGERVPLGDAVATIPTRYALLSTNADMLQFRANPGREGAIEGTIQVPAAHMYSITLADGTIVHLNAATALRFPFRFDGDTREVFVDGEAYFSVAKDAKRPFIVHTKKGDVNVLGTDFNINTYENNFIVSLISGSVVVKPGKGKPVQLKPCEEAALDPLSLETSLATFRSEEVMSWLHGQYRFQLQSLPEVCKVAERLYGVKIRFDRERMGKAKFTGMIDRKEPITAFLEKLKENGKVDTWYYDKAGVLHLDWNEHK